MLTFETPEQVCDRFAPQIRDALRRARRVSLRYSNDLDGLHITVGAKKNEETVDEDPALPPELRLARPATRDVYRLLVELRTERGDDARIMPADIMGRQQENTNLASSRDTVNHALFEMRSREIAWSHPVRGWVLGCERPTLTGCEADRVPISAGHSERSSQATPLDYSQRVPHDSRARSRGVEMLDKKWIWVPMEDGLVTDAKTERIYPAGEHVAELTYQDRRGRDRAVTATRGELLRVDGKLAVVKIAGGHTIHTPVLGDWHLAGETAPATQEAAA